MLSWRRVGACLLLLQGLWFAHEQMGPSRYFCWAPLHEHVHYRIVARVEGKRLSDAEIAARYGRSGAAFDASRGEFWELNAAAHVIDSIAWREAITASGKRAQVTLHYQIDDGQERRWTYSP